jgi:pimeloyl-ACP methyl ester carboxylesterase
MKRLKIHERYFDYRGIKLYYFIVGRGKPLLFIPGGLRVTTYMNNLSYLVEDYQVIGVDLPGFGKSSTPHDVWALEDYAQLMSSFLAFLKLRKVPVIGHSYGGGVGLYLAMMDSHVTKLMAFSPMGVASDHTPFGFFFNVLVTKSINDYFAMKSQRLRSIVFNNAISTVTENFSNAKKMIQITNKVLYRHTTPKNLAKITIPVRLMWGKNDELFPVANGYYLQKHIAGSTLEILDGNHDWLTINPEESAKKIKDFLNTN